MNPVPAKAIIFDLGNVLIGVDFDRAVQQATKYTTLNADEIKTAVISSSILLSYEEGQIDDTSFCSAMIKLLQMDIQPADFAVLWADCFNRWPEMEALFYEVRQHLPVAILSNTSPLHCDCIFKAVPDFLQADYLALSYELGMSKPEPDIYLAVTSALEINSQECLFIDDLKVNVEGALSIGMQAFQFTTPEDTKRRIYSLLRKK